MSVTKYKIMTANEARFLLWLAALAALLMMCTASTGEDEQGLHLSADGDTYYMAADVMDGFTLSNTRKWIAANDNIFGKFVGGTVGLLTDTGKGLFNTGAATIKNAKNDPIETAVVAWLALKLTDNDPFDSDDKEKDKKGFKTEHQGLAPNQGDSRTGVRVDRHGCSVETSSSVDPITVDAEFGESGSAACSVQIGEPPE
jgi:hypothetical protein